METDEYLFSLFCSGNEHGLHELMERYGDKLTLYINGYIHDITESEDLMIEAFSRISFKKPTFNENGFKSYLYKTGRNLALRHCVKQRQRNHFYIDELKNEPQAKQIVEDIACESELECVLKLSMEQINPDYKEALYLIYIEGMSYAEASHIMKKNEKQIANLVFRGKNALKPILQKEGIISNAKY
ncbi:MAG: RNA polymerase sigma factor [Oscillospiraceae bacterium]